MYVLSKFLKCEIDPMHYFVVYFTLCFDKFFPPSETLIFFFSMDGASVSKVLAEKWKALPSNEQQEFYVEAEKLKNLHQLQHPNYKYKPQARRLGMKKSVAKSDHILATGYPVSGAAVSGNHQLTAVSLIQPQNPIPIPQLPTTSNFVPIPIQSESLVLPSQHPQPEYTVNLPPIEDETDVGFQGVECVDSEQMMLTPIITMTESLPTEQPQSNITDETAEQLALNNTTFLQFE